MFIFLGLFFIITSNLTLLYALDEIDTRVTVVHVYDGDSLLVRDNNQFYQVRLAYIDAPEKDQLYAAKSRNFLKQLCDNRTVSLRVITRDKYDRVVAEVFYDDLNINESMVKNGYAWWYRQFGNPVYGQLEAYAKRHEQGLWVLLNPVPPWEFRNRNRRVSDLRQSGSLPKSGDKQHTKTLTKTGVKPKLNPKLNPKLKSKFIRFKKGFK